MAYLTTLSSLTATPSVVLTRWMQDEAIKAADKAERIYHIDRDPLAVQKRIEQAQRDGITPDAADVAQKDWRGQFLVSCLEAVKEHQDAARRGAGDLSAHTNCIVAWRLAAKAAQVGLKLEEVKRFVAIAERRSAELVGDARKARRQRRAA